MNIIIQTKKNFWYISFKGIRKVSLLEHFWHLPRIKEFLKIVHPKDLEELKEVANKYFPDYKVIEYAVAGETFSPEKCKEWGKLEKEMNFVHGKN